MRIWLLLPVLALVMAGAVALSANEPGRLAQKGRAVAAVETPAMMNDACVWTADTASAEADPCGEAVHAERRAFVWPDDLITVTADAAVDVWQATVGFLTGIYDYVFESEEPAREAGS